MADARLSTAATVPAVLADMLPFIDVSNQGSHADGENAKNTVQYFADLFNTVPSPTDQLYRHRYCV